MNRRVRVLKEDESTGGRLSGPVVFWMNRDQRAEDHWGLLYAREQARLRNTFLVVVFMLVPNYLTAQKHHYRFMIEGLKETANELGNRGIPFHLYHDQPETCIPSLVSQWKAPLLVTDFNPLRLKRQWESVITESVPCGFHQVDAHNLVPCWEASPKLEYAAYTFRPRIHRQLPHYLTQIPPLTPQRVSADWHRENRWNEETCSDPASSRLLPPPGAGAACEQLKRFLDGPACRYGTERNDPLKQATSGLSPYLHFGQISAQRVVLETLNRQIPADHRDAFLEELIVRRELSDNFCFYQSHYDRPEAYPDWAKSTLKAHDADQRDYLYTLQELENAGTHDQLWNAVQIRMKMTGSLHGYLRMYWAKKILEWSPGAAQAHETAVTLNDRYFLDGRDPNGYAGIAWALGGVHDRAWPERPIFGKIRYMNLKGCRRKFDVDAYIQQTKELK